MQLAARRAADSPHLALDTPHVSLAPRPPTLLPPLDLRRVADPYEEPFLRLAGRGYTADTGDRMDHRHPHEYHSSSSASYPHHHRPRQPAQPAYHPPPHPHTSSYPHTHLQNHAPPSGPTRPPSLTLQRPSYPHPSDLPPLEHIRPGSISDPRVPLGLGIGHASHSPPTRSPPGNASSSSSAQFAPPPLPHISRRPSQPASQSHPPHYTRRTSYTGSSVPSHPSGLRYPARTSPSTSPKFDLSQYSMSADDRSRLAQGGTSPTSRSEGTSPGARLGATLPPLRLPSPTTSAVDPAYVSPRHANVLSPTELASGPSRKRDREDEVNTPGSSHSRASSSFVITPQMEIGEPPMKRRGSTLDSLLINDKDVDVKPVISSWNDWERRGSISSVLNSTREKSSLDKVADMPIGPIQPIVAFPFQFGYSSTGPNPAAQGPSTNGTAPAGSSSIDRDPALSSVRSSADQANNGNGTGHSSTNSPQVPPELRFTEDTLHSAGASPAPGVLEAALQQAAAHSVEAMGSGSNSAGGHDQNRLSVPGDDGDDRKEQPFSRSPELRISHKLAERKRRKEMKDLFDELRDLLPAERGGKSSKWEILSKAIDYIVKLKDEKTMAIRDVERLKRELDAARGGVTFPSYGSYAPAPSQQAHQSGPQQQQHQVRPVPAVNVSGPGGVGVGKQQALPGSNGSTQPAHSAISASAPPSQGAQQQVPASLSAAAAAVAAQGQAGPAPSGGAKPESNGVNGTTAA